VQNDFKRFNMKQQFEKPSILLIYQGFEAEGEGQ
jgi:hypothetical protein